MHTTTTTVVVTAEEALLLRRVADGDHGEPLVALYHRYASRLYGLGLRLMGDAGMAEELVQETFLRLWRSARRYDAERGSVRTFLFAIARRVAVDLLRRTASARCPPARRRRGSRPVRRPSTPSCWGSTYAMRSRLLPPSSGRCSN